MQSPWAALVSTSVDEASTLSQRRSPNSGLSRSNHATPQASPIWSHNTIQFPRASPTAHPLARAAMLRPLPAPVASTSYFRTSTTQNYPHQLNSSINPFAFDQFFTGNIAMCSPAYESRPPVLSANFLQRSLLLASTPPPIAPPSVPFANQMPIHLKNRFCELSKEIHERICDLLAPRHIARWSSVNRTCWIYTTRLKGIWSNALKKLCQNNSVLLSTFSYLEDRSGSQLAWLTAMPDRLHYWMKKQPDDAFIHTRRTLDILNSSHPQPQSTSRHPGLAMLLVPGGRYLIVDDGKQMTISDLGVGSQSQLQWVSTIKHGQPRRSRQLKSTIDVYPAPNGVDLRVIVFFDRLRDRLGTFHVYNVKPKIDGGESAVRLLSTHTENDKQALYTFREDILITLVGSNLFLRNFITKLEVSMKIHNDPPAKILMCSKPGHIVLVHMHGFSMWRIPNFLYTSVNGEGLYSLPDDTIPPQFSLPINFTEHMDSDTGRKGTFTAPVFEKPSVWYEEFGNHPLVFDLVRNRFGKDPCQFRWRYQLTLPSSRVSAGVPSIECITRFVVPHGWTNMHISGYSNDRILLTGMCDDGFGGVVSAPAVSPIQCPEVDTGCYSGLLFLKRREMFSGQFVFCPVTGRVCYESTPYLVNVLDYFHL